MDRSKFSNIIATTRLLPHLSTENISVLKLCIFDQLGCENESQFICKALKSLYKTMSVESTAVIKAKTIELADSQAITQRSNNCNGNRTMTVYKYISRQYNDVLSKLHSDIIDYVGTFLSKRQSIEFGYLNKQLYIETQKYSYLSKRCKDDVFIFEQKQLLKLHQTESNIFNYSLPTDMKLELPYQCQLPKNDSFNLFFRRLNTIECRSIGCLAHLPCHVLFNRNYNQNIHGSQSRNKTTITKFSINANLYPLKHTTNAVHKFCEEFNRYKNNSNVVRNINRLQLKLEPQTDHRPHSDTLAWTKQSITKEILLSLGSISTSICLIHGILVIKSLQQLQAIFHEKLKKLSLSQTTVISIHDNIKITDGTCIGDLRSILIDLRHFDLFRQPIVNSFKCLDKFSIRRLIKSYTINWRPSGHYFQDDGRLPLCNIATIFDKLLFKDCDKHPLLEKITIILSDKPDLCGFARLLIYLNQQYRRLFGDDDEAKLDLKHFKKIEIKFQQFANSIKRHEPVDRVMYNDREMIFVQNGDKWDITYPIHLKMIKIKNIKQGIEHFAIIYQNIFKWLQSKQIHSCDNGANAVVFLI